MRQPSRVHRPRPSRGNARRRAGAASGARRGTSTPYVTPVTRHSHDGRRGLTIIEQLRQELAAARAELAATRALLQATAVELNKWGWPTLDYGEDSLQAESVVLAVTAVDVFLDGKP